MRPETLKLLQAVATRKVQITAQQAAEQQRRLQQATAHEVLFLQHAAKLEVRTRQWLDQDSGCPTHLLLGAQHFHKAMHTALDLQHSTILHLQETQAIAAATAGAAQRLQRQIMHLFTQQQQGEASTQRQQEQRLNDNLCTRPRVTHQ
ncbi:hypothetical protein JKG47_00165 [Acidithiobacillus sp. MC6.1]|nr:hypothetical protein [Acidithiobacillus sp. MC6.1]